VEMIDRFESLIDRIENRATERIMSKQAVMGARLVVCIVLVVVTEGKCDVFGVSYLLLSRAGVIEIGCVRCVGCGYRR
jgi:hypothetical protein